MDISLDSVRDLVRDLLRGSPWSLDLLDVEPLGRSLRIRLRRPLDGGVDVLRETSVSVWDLLAAADSPHPLLPVRLAIQTVLAYKN